MASIAAQWDEHVDGSGRTYFVHRETRETSWAVPGGSGWVELFDPSSGRPYFVHEKTRTTTWERPAALQEEEVKQEDF